MLEMDRNDIDLWLVDEREIVDTDLLAHYHQLLNEEELARHQRLVFNKHQHLFLVARALVRSVLAGYLGLDDPGSITFRSNANGKPELDLETNLQFNLSHTNGLIALVVMQDAAVGVDVEYLSRKADIASLAQRYFSMQESEAMLAMPVAQWNERFFDLWTLKEAFLKACGTGLTTPLHEFSFSLDGGAIEVSFSPLLAEDPLAWHFWQLQLDRGYRLSLAVNDGQGRDFQLKVKQGIPMQEFNQVSPDIVCRSVR